MFTFSSFSGDSHSSHKAPFFPPPETLTKALIYDPPGEVLGAVLANILFGLPGTFPRPPPLIPECSPHFENAFSYLPRSLFRVSPT